MLEENEAYKLSLDAEVRRQNGVEYTDEETILKVINPLFLEDLKTEFEKSKNDIKLLKQLHNKISNIKILDPACGCGNFLLISYFYLCELEKNIIECLIEKNVDLEIKVNANQFYGIEIDDEACKMAAEGMERAYNSTNEYYSKMFNGGVFKRCPFLPPKIVNENALRIDWDEVISKKELNYIIGNPPYVGYFKKSPEQRKDMELVFGKKVKHGQLDYVCAWYKKASDYMKDTKIEAAFVSTNSISQGQQPAILWEPLMKENKSEITFAYKTFKWGNEAKGKKAQVHCVIIGFDDYLSNKNKKIYNTKGSFKNVININPYLKNAPNIVVKTRSHPICDAPEMNKGSQPTDGGFLLLNESEKEKLIQENSLCKKWIRPFMGAKEFLNGEKRWCLWLVNAKPNELRKCKLVLKRIDSVRKLRLKSKAASTRKASNIASLFTGIRQPNSKYLIFPEISSEKRQYVPIKFAKKNIISSNKLQLIPNATLYDFGILESIVHMAWMRAVCGRLEMRYIYSNSIVYNNFIWPKPTPEQKAKIEKCAQAVLDARKLYPDSTLADLYDPNTMPPELVKAHENLDKAVKDAYGNKGFETEEEIVSSLMKLYKKAIDKENKKRGL